MAVPRSPNYPSLSLDAALDAVAPAFKAESRNKMGRLTLAKHLGYTSINGRSLSKIGALRAYGLIEGGGDELRVSEDAVICLKAPVGSPDRKAALERCATRPALFKQIRADFPDSLPSSDNLGFWLAKNGYTDRGAGKAADTYLSTMRLVDPPGSAYSPSTDEGEKEEIPPPPEIEVGDLVQVEINGAFQLEKPARVREIRDHGGQTWVLTEASDAWVLMEQAIFQAKGTPTPPPPHPPLERNASGAKEGWREERLLDDAGEEIFISYKGDATAERYQFIRDYLNFKLVRLGQAMVTTEPKTPVAGVASEDAGTKQATQSDA